MPRATALSPAMLRGDAHDMLRAGVVVTRLVCLPRDKRQLLLAVTLMPFIRYAARARYDAAARDMLIDSAALRRRVDDDGRRCCRRFSPRRVARRACRRPAFSVFTARFRCSRALPDMIDITIRYF